MLDIPAADNLKLRLRLFMYFINKELTKRAKEYGLVLRDGQTVLDAMHEDMQNCTNPVISRAYQKMILASKSMGESYQSEIINQMGVVFLWILYRDTAYRDPFFWMISEITSEPDFQSVLQPYVKPPELWYCPNWNMSKKITSDKKELGELGRFDMSQTEDVFVPARQAEKTNKYLDSLRKQNDWDKIVSQVEEKTQSSNKRV